MRAPSAASTNVFRQDWNLSASRVEIHQGDHPHLALSPWCGLPEVVFQQPPEVMRGIAGYDATRRLAGRASETHGKPYGAGHPQSHFAAQWSVRAVLAQNDRGAVRHGADLIKHHGTGIPEACARPAESLGTGQRPHASDECQGRLEGANREEAKHLCRLVLVGDGQAVRAPA
jgi:hypothetical protein